MSCVYISGLANNIYEEIGSPSSTSVSFISGKLVSNAFLGQLGSLTYKCYSGISGCIEPPLDAGEQAIYSLLYLGDYWKKKVTDYIGDAAVKKVLSVREGDSSITIASPTEQAKVIRGLSKDYTEQAKEMADLYNRGQATARGVSFYTIDPYTNSSLNNGCSPDFNR